MGLVEIEYDDVDDGFTDIADDVLYRTAGFESQLAAIPGMFEMTVKDVDQIYDFLTGREVRLTVGGQRYWGGYLTQAEMFYATIVDTSVPADVKVRQWNLRGVDYNILFDKRVVANYANPTSGLAKFDIGSQDGDVIRYLIANYLDLDADDLDYSGIENVAVINEDAKGTYGVPGEKWRQSMQRYANSTGATWYIDWNKKVVNRAREDVELAWGFSDVPDNVDYFGSREIRYTKDGASIVNDALIWGGTGFTGTVVFGRVQNSDSIGEGLRMQFGATHFNDNHYATNKACRIHAAVIVTGAPGTVAIVGNGPDSERGLQNAQQLLSMAWFYGMVPGPLVPGTVVTTRLFTFGSPKIITLPLRGVRITFLSPEIIRFDGQFGIQTTDPYSLWAYMKRQLLEEDQVQYIPPISDTATEPVPGGTYNSNVTPLPDGTTTVFSLRFPYIASSTRVTKNGLTLVRGVDYAETDPATGQITLTTAPAESDGIYATAQAIGTGGTPSGPSPFPPPATTGTVSVSSGTDRTGATNVAATLNALIAGAPDGSVIDFPFAGGIYRLDDGLHFYGKNNIVLQGNNATTLVMHGTDVETFSTFHSRGSSHIRFTGFTVNGAYGTARGAGTWPGQAGEGSHCLGLSGFFGGRESSYIEMDHITGDHFYGDFAYFEGENVGAQRPSHDVWIHDCVFDYCGRNAVSPINVTDVMIENNTFDHMAYHCLDCEPNQNAEEIRRVTFRNNTVGIFAARSGLIGHFFSCYSPNDPPISEITVSGNTVAGIAADGVFGNPRCLHATILGESSHRYQNIAMVNNTGTRTVAGSGVIYAQNIDGLQITGNTQPLSSGTLVGTSGCPGAITSPNP